MDDGTLSNKVDRPRRNNMPVFGLSNNFMRKRLKILFEINGPLGLRMMLRTLIRWAEQEDIESPVVGSIFCV
jgi:hypothetical protein